MEVQAPMRGYSDLGTLAELPVRRFLVTSDSHRLQESMIKALAFRHLFTARPGWLAAVGWGARDEWVCNGLIRLPERLWSRFFAPAQHQEIDGGCGHQRKQHRDAQRADHSDGQGLEHVGAAANPVGQRQ